MSRPVGTLLKKEQKSAWADALTAWVALSLGVKNSNKFQKLLKKRISHHYIGIAMATTEEKPEEAPAVEPATADTNGTTGPDEPATNGDAPVEVLLKYINY